MTDKPEVPDEKLDELIEEYVHIVSTIHPENMWREAKQAIIDYHDKCVATRLKSCIDANKIILADMMDSYENKQQDATMRHLKAYQELASSCAKQKGEAYGKGYDEGYGKGYNFAKEAAIEALKVLHKTRNRRYTSRKNPYTYTVCQTIVYNKEASFYWKNVKCKWCLAKRKI